MGVPHINMALTFQTNRIPLPLLLSTPFGLSLNHYWVEKFAAFALTELKIRLPGTIIANDMVLFMNLLHLIHQHRMDLQNVRFVRQWMMSERYFAILGWDTHIGRRQPHTRLKLETLSLLVVIL
jgi:hypothetical protein